MLTVLILEDDPLIALDMAATVEDDGDAKWLWLAHSQRPASSI